MNKKIAILIGYFGKDDNIQTSVCTATTKLTDTELLRQLEKMK